MTRRATTIRINAIAISVSAAPQPRAWAPTYGDDAFAKICDGSGVGAAEHVAVHGGHREDGEQQRRRLTAARATASSAPLTIPPSAVGSTTVTVTRALLAPRA